MKNKTGESIIRAAAKQDEPTFTFRAKDGLSTSVLTYYNLLTADAGCSPEFREEIRAITSEFYDWQAKNTDKVKKPD